MLQNCDAVSVPSVRTWQSTLTFVPAHTPQRLGTTRLSSTTTTQEPVSRGRCADTTLRYYQIISCIVSDQNSNVLIQPCWISTHSSDVAASLQDYIDEKSREIVLSEDSENVMILTERYFARHFKSPERTSPDSARRSCRTCGR